MTVEHERVRGPAPAAWPSPSLPSASSRDGALAADMRQRRPSVRGHRARASSATWTGALDADWSLEAPAGVEPDYRLLSATGDG